MEIIHNHPLIEVTEEDIKKTRLSYGLEDVNRITQSLDAIEKWWLKQDHLAGAYKYFNRNILERILISSNGSIEDTKKRIDKLLTSRGMVPELSLNRNIGEFERFWQCVNYVPLPKVNPIDQSRVMVTQFLTDKLEEFSLLSYFRYCFMIGEYRIHFDYTVAERYIIDLRNIHIGMLSKVNPIVLKKAETLCTEGSGTKVKGVHILNAPYFVDKLVFILKQAMQEKVASRIHVHSNYNDLHKHIPKEILPEEYGGDSQSCNKLAEQWKATLSTDEAEKIMRNLDHMISDESKRHVLKFNEEYLGMPGSFRSLAVD